MKLTSIFLLLLALIFARRLKKRETHLQFENLRYLAHGGFGLTVAVTREKEKKERFVIKFPLTHKIVEDLNLNIEFKEHHNVLEFFKIEVEALNFLKRYWTNEHPSNHLDHQTHESLQKYEIEIEKAVVSPFGYKLNSDDDRIVLIKYDCDLFEFVNEHRNKSKFQQVGRLIQAKIIRAIDFLQLNNVLHRDIKLENFMIKVDAKNVTACNQIKLSEMLKNKFYVAIIDFGFSTLVQVNQYSPLGTRVTMAPEVYFFTKNEPETFKEFIEIYNVGYNFSADVYSVAVTLLEIETKLQFSGERFVSFIDNREKIEQMLNSTEGQYKQLLVQMLKMNPNERITIHQVKNQFESLNEVKPNAPTENKGFRASCKRIWNRIRRRRSEYIN